MRDDLLLLIYESCRVARHRTFLEFAQQELILPTGPRAGLPFSVNLMPWTRLVLEEFDRGRYRRFFASGPVQSGKTLLFFCLPALYHLFEMGESVIIGVPKIDLAQAIYEERLLPVIRASRYASLLPTRGAGSRGGKFISVTFGNGATLRFMGAGGGDAQRSSHTARVVILTEIDKMDEPGESSREADPVTQIEARARAFGSRARIYAECTMSTRHGRVFREVTEWGTDTRIFFPCPKCGEFSATDRKQFSGWQAAQDVMGARLAARYLCPACGGEWTEADRGEALKRPVLASKGQRVTPEGLVEGEAPATNTWGFRWTAMASALLDMGDIAEAEFRAERSSNPEDMKALLQFTWAEPYEEEILNLSGLTREIILGRITRNQRGTIPPEAVKVTVGVDLGLYRCWWVACAWRADASGQVIDYGCLEVPQGREVSPLAILSSLRAFRDEALRAGWKWGDGSRPPDLVLVDSGYQPEIGYRWCEESGKDRYFPCKGLGTGRNQGAWHDVQPGENRKVGDGWFATIQPNGSRLVSVHADRWKEAIHEGFNAPPGGSGSLGLFHAEPREHLTFARHITAERREEEFVPGRGLRRYWARLHKDNHYLDTCAYARCGAEMLGIRLVTRPPAALLRRSFRAPAEVVEEPRVDPAMG